MFTALLTQGCCPPPPLSRKNHCKNRLTTEVVAVAGAPSMASFELTVLVVLVCTPIAMPVTFTEKVQEAPGARVAPDKLMLFEPAIAVMVPPPHEPVRTLGVDTTRADGSVSVNTSPVSVVRVFGFVSVKLRAVLPKNKSTCESAKVLVRVGGEITLSVADAAVPFPPSVEVTGPLVLFFTPSVTARMFTLNVQDAPAGSVAPVRLTVPEPAVAVMVPPPHEPLRPFGVATIRPDGSVSVKPTPLNDAAAFGFVMVKLRLVLPFGGIVAAPKVLVIVGAKTRVVSTFVNVKLSLSVPV